MLNSEEKKRAQSKEQIFHNFVQILESFPQYTIAQHLYHILRKKGDLKDPYFWTDSELLKKFEHYYDELNNELLLKREEKIEEEI